MMKKDGNESFEIDSMIDSARTKKPSGESGPGESGTDGVIRSSAENAKNVDEDKS